jgi:hypothetical protein
MRQTAELFPIATFIAIAILQAAPASATPPSVYSRPNYQSPVQGDPDDLLLIPGEGFAPDDIVVYRALNDTTQRPSPPQSIPTHSDAHDGIAAVVSTVNIPYSLTVKLPLVMVSGQAYALWVHSNTKEWSDAVRINDARPLWITPDHVYASNSLANLPRTIKIVGRNLEAAPGATTQLRLVGAQSYTLDVHRVDDSTRATEPFVAEVRLPARISTGTYAVQVSRDGVSWIPVDRQKLTVRADPSVPRKFNVSDAALGGCRPDNARDVTPCLIAAITAARAAGGGEVDFDAGTWILMERSMRRLPSPDGIVLPIGVNLRGAGAKSTRLIRERPQGPCTGAVLSLQGDSVVEGFAFVDANIYGPSDPPCPFVQLGTLYSGSRRLDPSDQTPVDEIIITRNIFDRPSVAVADAGAPIRHLFLTYNEFGAYRIGLDLSGNRYITTRKYHIDDSIVAFNSFKPGSYIDAKIGQGAIASSLGASHRLDFSNNSADGAAADYLYAPTDAHGWRAAFFWSLNNSQEMSLVADNVATCTGDKLGDGEAIAYDDNGNTPAFGQAMTVQNATEATVIVSGELAHTQNDREVPSSEYYSEHWVQIVAGPGLGQARRIASYSIDPRTAHVTFSVRPSWDVIPAAQKSRVVVQRQYWQVYTLNNRIDQRRPLCRKSNRTEPKGGVITMWAPSTDSVIDGNVQFDTDGIKFQQGYSAVDPLCKECTSWAMAQMFLEIRGNAIQGKYDWDSNCSESGISGWYGASPTPSSPPPVMSYGVSIVRNTVEHADGLRGGGISTMLAWHAGPPPHDQPLVRNLIIQHNALSDIEGSAPNGRCANSQPSRIGINLDQTNLVQGTILYANSCNRLAKRLYNGASRTVRVCPSSVQDSCECEN